MKNKGGGNFLDRMTRAVGSASTFAASNASNPKLAEAQDKLIKVQDENQRLLDDRDRDQGAGLSAAQPTV